MLATPWRARKRRRSAGRRWLLLLLALAPLAALTPAGCLPTLAERPILPAAAHVLHCGHGMNTTPSTWLLGWLVLGAFAAGVLSFVQTLQRAALLPQPVGEGAVDRDWRPWLLAALVMLALLGVLLLVAQREAPYQGHCAARGLHGLGDVGRTPWWLPWLLAALVTLAVVAFLVALQQAGL